MFRLAVIIAISIVTTGSAQKPVADSVRIVAPKKKMTITEVLKKHTDTWMKIPGVIGTGEGRKNHKPAIMVFVEKRSKSIEHQIPASVDGYSVVFQETGVIKAQ
jgi:hypothetical protein